MILPEVSETEERLYRYLIERWCARFDPYVDGKRYVFSAKLSDCYKPLDYWNNDIKYFWLIVEIVDEAERVEDLLEDPWEDDFELVHFGRKAFVQLIFVGDELQVCHPGAEILRVQLNDQEMFGKVETYLDIPFEKLKKLSMLSRWYDDDYDDMR